MSYVITDDQFKTLRLLVQKHATYDLASSEVHRNMMQGLEILDGLPKINGWTLSCTNCNDTGINCGCQGNIA